MTTSLSPTRIGDLLEDLQQAPGGRRTHARSPMKETCGDSRRRARNAAILRSMHDVEKTPALIPCQGRRLFHIAHSGEESVGAEGVFPQSGRDR